MNLRVSVSDLDQVIWYKRTDMTLDQLLSRLRREEEPSEAMLAGTALHKFLENFEVGVVDEFEQDGCRFRMAMDEDIELALPAIRELKGEKEYDIDGVIVTLVGKVDGMDWRVFDHKLTKRFDAETYSQSMQWRGYLSIFGADAFTYNVFEGYKARDGVWTIKNFHTLNLFRYPGMGADLLVALTGFVRLVRDHMPERLAA